MEALDAYAAARPPVPAPPASVVAGDPKQRQRFQVELIPDETTVVSWKKLVQEANNEVVSDDSPDEDLEDYTRVEKSTSKESGSLFKRDKVQHKTGRKKFSKLLNVRTRRKQMMDSVISAAHQKLKERKSSHHDVQSRTLMNKSYEREAFTNIKQRNNKGRNNLPDLNLPYTEYASNPHALRFI